jgi:hypothetical protein
MIQNLKSLSSKEQQKKRKVKNHTGEYAGVNGLRLENSYIII